MHPKRVYYQAMEMFSQLPVVPRWKDPDNDRRIAKGCAMEVFMNATGIRPVMLVDAADFHPESGWGRVGYEGMIELSHRIVDELLPDSAVYHSEPFGCFIYDTKKLSKKDFTGLRKITNRSIEKVGRLLGYPCADHEGYTMGVSIYVEDEEDEIQVSAQVCDRDQVVRHFKKFLKLAEKLEKAIKRYDLPMERVEIRIDKSISHEKTPHPD